MTDSIIRYINFLKKEYCLAVSIHDINNSFGNFVGKLAPYNIHSNPYCMYVKSCKESWLQCHIQQNAAADKCAEGIFFGSCYSGAGEFVVPIKNDGAVIGFISVSGYQGSEEKMLRFAEKYEFPPNILAAAYETHLSSLIPDITFVQTVTEPLSAMLSLLYIKNPPKQNYSGGYDYIYGHVLSILKTRYSEKITLASLAKTCHCSESLICRIFKEKNGMSVNKYLNYIRIEKAKELLCSSDISISETAALCGFTDSNYFIYTFGKTVGISPKKYQNSKHFEIRLKQRIPKHR